MSNEHYDQLHLDGKRMCHRGVRVEELPVDVVQAIEEEAYANVGEEGNPVKLTNEKWRLGAMRMIRQVTDPVDTLDGVTWKSVSLQDLMQDGPMKFERLFPRPHDRTVLGKKYQELHEITVGEVDAVLGKASTVLKE